MTLIDPDQPVQCRNGCKAWIIGRCEGGFTGIDESCTDIWTEHGREKAVERIRSGDYYASLEFTHWRPMATPPTGSQTA